MTKIARLKKDIALWKAARASELYSTHSTLEFINNALFFLTQMKVKSRNKDEAIYELYRAILDCDGTFTPDNRKTLEALGYTIPKKNRSKHDHN